MGTCTSSLEAIPLPNGVKDVLETNPQSLFSKALSSKDVAVEDLEKLIASKVDVNYKMEHETIGTCYPLHIATKIGNEKALQLLLKAGADPNLPNSKGETPLHTAVQDSKIDIIEKLIQGKADINVISTEGASPLLLAVQNNNLEVVGALINAGADPNGSFQKSPLVTAAKGNYVDIVMILLKNGALHEDLNFEFATEEGHANLHSWAKTKDHGDVIRWLQENSSIDEIQESSGEQLSDKNEKNTKNENEGEVSKDSDETRIDAKNDSPNEENFGNLKEEPHNNEEQELKPSEDATDADSDMGCGTDAAAEPNIGNSEITAEENDET